MTTLNSRLGKVYAELTAHERGVLMYEAVCEGRGEVEIPLIRKPMRRWQFDDFRRQASIAAGIFQVIGSHALSVRQDVELLLEKRTLIYVLASWGVDRPSALLPKEAISETQARGMIRRRRDAWARADTSEMTAAVESAIAADIARFDEALAGGTFGEPFQPDAFRRWLGEPLTPGPSHPTQVLLGSVAMGEWDAFALQTLDELSAGASSAWARLEAVELVLDEKLRALGSKAVHPALQQTLRWSKERLDELFDVLKSLGRTVARPPADGDTAEQIRDGMAAVRL